MRSLLHKVIFFFLLGIVLQGICCSSQFELRQELQLNSGLMSVKSDGSFYIYSDCNIFVKEMSASDWSKLLRHSFYVNSASHPSYRIPKLLFFHVIMENREKTPMVFEDAIVEYNGQQHRMLTMTELASLTKAPLYRRINFAELLSFRRFFENEEELYMLESINYNNTVKYLFEHVSPYDKVLRIMAFNRIPAGVREFTLKFYVKYPQRKKVIDFVFKRFEYRVNDEHYKKKKTVYAKDDYL